MDWVGSKEDDHDDLARSHLRCTCERRSDNGSEARLCIRSLNSRVEEVAFFREYRNPQRLKELIGALTDESYETSWSNKISRSKGIRRHAE